MLEADRHIHKKGSTKNIENYRLVASRSKLSLCLERLLFSKLCPIMESQIFNNQHGFLKRKSTLTQLHVRLKLLQDAFENRKDIYTLYLDFLKAFDRVCLQIILKKLRTFGIGGNLLKLLSSHLQNRGQRKIVNDYASEFEKITSRFPRDSFLGPLLFIIIINFLPDCCTNSHVLILADDTKLTTKSHYELQNELLRLHDWAFENKMVFIADKTKLIWFSLKTPDVKEQPILVFEDEYVSFYFEPFKDLSFHFASTLSWILRIEKRLHDVYGRFISLKRNLSKLISSRGYKIRAINCMQLQLNACNCN